MTLLTSLAFLFALAALQEPQAPRGQIVDVGGKPVAGAELFPCWTFSDPGGAKKAERPAPLILDDSLPAPLLTDERGEFPWPEEKELLFALDLAGRRGGLALPPPGAKSSVPAKIQPLVTVHGRFEVQAAGDAPKTCALWVASARGVPSFFAVCFTESREFSLALPPGEYSLFYSTDAESLYSMSQLETGLSIPSGSAPIDVGVLALELPLVAHLRGIVLAQGGKPLPSPRIGTSWLFDGVRSLPFDHFEGDEQGRFQGKIEFFDAEREQALLAYTPDFMLGALQRWKPKTLALELSLQLAPTVRVHGRYVIDGTNAPVASTNTEIFLPDRLKIGDCRSKSSQFDLRLPPGKYRLVGYGSGVRPIARELELTPEQLDLDLGTLGLPPDMFPLLKGKEAPAWKLTDARGLERDAELADFRGKWVLLEFWSYGCHPCVTRGLPGLVRLQERLAEHRDEFVILAFHDDSVEDFTELDATLAPIVTNLWKGTALPFPILLDKSGETFARYGIHGMPTNVLIDPEGRVVAQNGEERLTEELQRKK